MKKENFLLLFVLTFLLFMSCSDNDLLDIKTDTICNFDGEPVIVLKSLSTKLFYNYDTTPMGTVINEPGIYYRINSPDALLKIDKDTVLYSICNFPKDAKNLKVSDKGVDIVLSGRVYESEDPPFKQLVLTKLKKK